MTKPEDSNASTRDEATRDEATREDAKRPNYTISRLYFGISEQPSGKVLPYSGIFDHLDLFTTEDD
jgi:hypothetical protein